MYLHEWLIFMVNVGKYTIHGWYWFSGKNERNWPAVSGTYPVCQNHRFVQFPIISPVMAVMAQPTESDKTTRL